MALLQDGRIVTLGPPKSVLHKFEFLNEDDDDVKEDTADLSNEVGERSELIEEETRETGRVKLDVYKNYWFAIGKIISPAILVSIALMQVSVLLL